MLVFYGSGVALAAPKYWSGRYPATLTHSSSPRTNWMAKGVRPFLTSPRKSSSLCGVHRSPQGPHSRPNTELDVEGFTTSCGGGESGGGWLGE